VDVMRALADSGRTDIALYTGNDDNIIADLVTPYVFPDGDEGWRLEIVGGLLGHWSVWTKPAVTQLRMCHEAVRRGSVSPSLLQLGVEVTDANGALFDVKNAFAGCIAGVHEVLRRQGLFAGIWCLDPEETLSPGQAEEIDRVCATWPHLTDDAFVAEHLDEWLS
jgi:hypothetical protein